MEVLYTNALFLLTKYFTFLRQFFKNSFLKQLLQAVAYFLYAYGCYLINAYSGCIVFILYGLKSFNLVHKVYSNIFGKILFTIGIGLLIYFFEETKILNITYLPYLIFLIDMWLINLVFKKKEKICIYLGYVKDIIWAIYGYSIKIYVLFIYKVMNLALNIFGNLLSKGVGKLNKRIY